MFDYKKYKWFFTKSGKLVVGGKSAESNDSLLKDLKKIGDDLMVMHTRDPGSPFCAILSPLNLTNKSDIEECAIFTGCFSRAWKEGKKYTMVHMFKLSQLNKSENMKSGTWEVRGRVKNFKVNLKLALTLQNKILKAVPVESVNSEDIIAFAIPGNVDKTKVKIGPIKVNREELISALPAGGVKIEK